MTCICKYPKIIIDKFDNNNRYIGMPEDEIVDGISYVPIDYRVDTVKNEDYVVAVWRRIGPDNIIKEYELVDNHIAKLGCDVSEQDIKNGNIKCREKQIYEVYHPIEEWERVHIIDFDKCKTRFK